MRGPLRATERLGIFLKIHVKEILINSHVIASFQFAESTRSSRKLSAQNKKCRRQREIASKKRWNATFVSITNLLKLAAGRPMPRQRKSPILLVWMIGFCLRRCRLSRAARGAALSWPVSSFQGQTPYCLMSRQTTSTTTQSSGFVIGSKPSLAEYSLSPTM